MEISTKNFYAKRKAARRKKHMDWWNFKAVVATNDKRQLKLSFEGTKKGKIREDEWWEFSQVPNSVEWSCEIPNWYHEDKTIRLLWDQKIVDCRMRKRKQQYLVHYSYPNDPDNDYDEWVSAKLVPMSLIENYKCRADSDYGIHEPHCPPWTESSDTDSDPYPVTGDEALEIQEALDEELQEFLPYLIENGVKKPKNKESKGDKFRAFFKSANEFINITNLPGNSGEQLTLQLIGKVDDEVAYQLR